jgi:uncharacterized protein (DUF362 family)
VASPKVAVLKTTPETVLEDYKRLAELAEMERYLQKGKTTILKDNISWHFLYPSANSTPWQVEGAILALKGNGYDDLVDVHNDTVVTNPHKGERFNKYDLVYKKHGVPVRFNCVPGDLEWVPYEPRGEMLVLREIYGHGIRIPEFFMGKNIVHLPTVKTHIYTTTTGSMKNAFGGLLNTRRHYTHSVIHETLVDLLIIQKEIHTGIFTFMDGTTAGSGPGPRTMTPHEKDVILASGDPVAIDAVAAKLMGFDPLTIPYIRIAHNRGLGVGDPREIEVVGEEISNVNWRFTVGDNFASKFGDLFWFSPLKILQKLLFHTPLVYLFVFGSALYHDYLWYPLKGKPIVERWKKESKWGRLFESYK